MFSQDCPMTKLSRAASTTALVTCRDELISRIRSIGTVLEPLVVAPAIGIQIAPRNGWWHSMRRPPR